MTFSNIYLPGCTATTSRDFISKTKELFRDIHTGLYCNHGQFIPGYNHGQGFIQQIMTSHIILTQSRVAAGRRPGTWGLHYSSPGISNMQVPCRCKHASRHLGANGSWFSNHYIVNKTLLSQEDEPAFLYFSKSQPSTSY